MTKTVAQLFEEAAGLVRGWGFTVVELDGWQTRRARSDIAFNPLGVINHHTGAWETTDQLLFRTGRTGLPAPLCHWTIYPDGTIALGAAGYANHAGNNDRAAVEKLLAGGPLDAEITPGPDSTYSANRRTVGIEVKCPAAYNPQQRAAAVALNAALILAFGWSRTRPPVGAHKEITRRKPGDPGDNMGGFRTDVAAYLATQIGGPAPTPAPVVTLPVLRFGSTGQWVRAVQRKLGVSPTGFYGLVTRARVRAWQKTHHLKVDGIAGPITLTALGITSA